MSRFQRSSAARRHCCLDAHDVFPCTCAESEPATVKPFHSEFLRWSVWFEEYLSAERGDLLVERFASDALERCHTVATDMVKSMLHVSQAS